jgi:hypothetical protein
MVLSRVSIGHDSFVKWSVVLKNASPACFWYRGRALDPHISFGDVRGSRYQSRSGRQSLALIELSPFLQERAGWPQDIGALVVLEGMEAAFRWDPDVRELLVSRLERWTEAFPRAAQVVHGRLFGWRMPYWFAMSDLDLQKQIGVVTVSAPGDERVLLDTCARL